MRRVVPILFIPLILVVLAVSTYQVFAQSDEEQEPVTVVTKEIEPFVFIDGDEVSGFSIDLWHALAQEAGVDFEFEIVSTVQEQIDAVENEQAAAAVAAISITNERETRIDFSHRYFQSGLGILTRTGGSFPLLNTFRTALSPNMLRLLALLAVTILIAAHIIWIMERRRNPEFPRPYFKGVWEGVWWAAATVTTVGYGDITPLGKLGRLFGMLWMFIGLFIIANFTAGVSSQLTVQRLQGVINGPDDLRGKSVVTVDGSTADEWLADKRIGHQTVDTIEEAYALLDDDAVQAVVYDRPVLLYYAHLNDDKGYFVTDDAFSRESYGIAFPHGSPLREDMNRALLKLAENGTYDQIYDKWYGVAFDQ